jgi:hypothetical protein
MCEPRFHYTAAANSDKFGKSFLVCAADTYCKTVATGQGGGATLPERMPFRLQKRNRSGDIMTATHTGLMALLNPGLAEK